MATKIVSLLPAATEIVCALGLENNLVGRSHECGFPETIKALPVCTAANFPTGLSSGDIDKKVKEMRSDALSVYSVNRELIKVLVPDVIITQAQCEVCAVSLNEVEKALNEFLDQPARILSMQPKSLDDVFNDITSIASVLNVAKVGKTLLEALQDRVGLIRHKLKYIEMKPTVACIEWLDPLMVSGNWVPDLVSAAGGTSVLTAAGEHSAYVQWDDIRLNDPDILVLMPCGFPIERTLAEVDILLQLPGFNRLKAVKNNQVYIADGDQYFNRPGPRIVDSVEILAEIFYPKQFIFGYEGAGWIRFAK